MSHCRQNSVRDKIIGKMWIYSDPERSTCLEYSCLENSIDRRAWQATVHGVAQVRHDLATKSHVFLYSSCGIIYDSVKQICIPHQSALEFPKSL